MVSSSFDHVVACVKGPYCFQRLNNILLYIILSPPVIPHIGIEEKSHQTDPPFIKRHMCTQRKSTKSIQLSQACFQSAKPYLDSMLAKWLSLCLLVLYHYYENWVNDTQFEEETKR